MVSQHDERLVRAECSLEGLSIGDAFGEQFFLSWDAVFRLLHAGKISLADDPGEGMVRRLIDQRMLPAARQWRYTDDTQMALSVVEILRKHGEINQDALALSFSRHYDTSRGYGAAMHSLLPRLAYEPWQQAASNLFGGQGSFGNGAAMRVAPIGAYFANDLDAVVENARRSAEVTHSHPEAAAGAIAVAAATALAWQSRQSGALPESREFLNRVLPLVPDSEVQEGIRHARGMIGEKDVREVVGVLGNGTGVTAQDTVPFVLWCAAQHLDNFEEAMWLTVSGLGDRDTTCAMAGGIVAMGTGTESIPQPWLDARETLPTWPFRGT